MFVFYIFMVLTGLCGIIFGFLGQNTLKSPYDTMAALFLPVSLILSLGGVLLLCVPHFL